MSVASQPVHFPTALPEPAVRVSSSDPITALYSEHKGWLHGWLRKKLGCAHNAADLAQDTFIRIVMAFKGKDDAAAQLREPRAYLTTVATRVLSNHYRRLSLEQAYVEALRLMPEAAAPSPEDRLVILETLNEIDALLDALPHKARTVFLAAQLDGLTYNEIALEYGIAPRSVRRYMALAYERCLAPQI
ncbi:sigma-70 family RNA polymerase sigma factor [Massilia oculi]|uniref:sigma-70 family RNA polymerase sigma factor n=1 Tax=Massilia oculi TaxID=945844 RepID=UPI00351D830B